TTLLKKVESLEADLKQTKQVYGASYTKLIMKGRFDEETDTQVSTQGEAHSLEHQPEDLLGVFSAAKYWHSGGISTVGASMPVSTTGMVQEVNIGIPSPVVVKDKGKGKMEESEDEQTKRTKLQQEQKRLSHEAVRLQEELDKEERQRMARVHEASQSFTEEEWENIRARVKADEELSKRLQAEERNKYKVGSSKRAVEAELDHEGSKRQKTNEASGSIQEQPEEEEKELDDLVMLWNLVKERFSSTEPTDDKERTLWVELKSSRRTVNVEETSSKAMLAIDGAGFNWSYMADDEVPTNMALMDFSDSEVHNDKTCSKTCLKSFETLKTQLDDLRIEFNKSEFNLANYKRELASIEEKLVFYKKNEVIFYEQLAVLKREISYKDSEISVLKSELEKLKQEKESNQLKIQIFDNASKSLDKLIGSQIPDKSRKGLGFFEGYGPKTSKSVSEDTFNEVRESPNASLVEELVSNDKLEKKTVVPTVTKINFVRPQQQEKPIRKPVNFDHVHANCNYHQRERTVSRNNYTRVNYNYFDKKAHPSAHRNIVPKEVLMKTGLRPLNTVRPKAVNTARPNTSVVNAVRANQVNAVKASACWVWRLTKLYSASITFKRHNYVDARGRSKHMTGNMSYLLDFKEFDGGYVTFRGGAKGGRNIVRFKRKQKQIE
ncbi:hypothetical protein Tco_0886001, partial [Tanacetum coccineum]